MDLLQIMPTLGVNLRPNTTYAAFVTDQVPLPAGNTIEQNGQLAGLLDPAQAEMPLPTRAIEVYAPLRDYMAQQGMAPASIIGATVWTTGDPTVKIRKGAEYAASLPIAPATEMTLLEEFPEYCEGNLKPLVVYVAASISLNIDNFSSMLICLSE